MKVTGCVYSRHKIITAVFVFVLSFLCKRSRNFQSTCFLGDLFFHFFQIGKIIKKTLIYEYKKIAIFPK